MYAQEVYKGGFLQPRIDAIAFLSKIGFFS